MLPNFPGRSKSKKKKNLAKTQIEDTKIDKANVYVCMFSYLPIVSRLPTTIKKINNNKN